MTVLTSMMQAFNDFEQCGSWHRIPYMATRDVGGGDRVVLITGASTGIGKACALHLDARGFRVFAGVRREKDAANLKKTGSKKLSPIFIDVTSEDSIARASEEMAMVIGDSGLDGLVNNAGISVGGPLELLPLSEVREQLEVNVFGQVAVTQAFLPHLRRAGGRIVNMSSISGRVASPLLGAYSMSKFALEAFSDSLRRELHPWGIEVSTIEPGAIATPIWDKSMKAAKERFDVLPKDALAQYRKTIDCVTNYAARLSETAISAEKVADAVHHALTSPKPRTRYLVGLEAKTTALLARFLPDRLLDKLIRKRMGL